MTQQYEHLRPRRRNANSEDASDIAEIRVLCAMEGVDPEPITTIYLNLTAQGGSFVNRPGDAMRIIGTYAIPAYNSSSNATLNTKKPPAIRKESLVTADAAYALKQAFIRQREANHDTIESMAEKLGMDRTKVKRLEADDTALSAQYFLSQAVIAAYAGCDENAVNLLARKAYETIFPKGLETPNDLVQCIAFRNGTSIQEFGKRRGVDNLSIIANHCSKVAGQSYHTEPLRKVLKNELSVLEPLGVSGDVLDRLIPLKPDKLPKKFAKREQEKALQVFLGR